MEVAPDEQSSFPLRALEVQFPSVLSGRKWASYRSTEKGSSLRPPPFPENRPVHTLGWKIYAEMCTTFSFFLLRSVFGIFPFFWQVNF